MFEWTRAWIRLRAEHSALRKGRLIDLFYDDDVYVFARQDQKRDSNYCVQSEGKEKKLTLPAGAIGLKDGPDFRQLIGARPSARVSIGQALLRVPSKTAVAYQSLTLTVCTRWTV